MNRYCFACDLIDDPGLIAEYEYWHKNVWPEVLQSITEAGITDMQIYRFGTRLFMVMEANDSFSFERKAEADATNMKVQEWEQLMWKFQQAIPGSKPGEKWVLMDKIFQL